MANVKLKRLRIEKYRNVAPGTELVFNDGFNVLLGQNGTGKTTLLNLIAIVTASRFASLRDTEFSLSYSLGDAGASVEVKIENARDEGLAVFFGEEFSWSYCVVLTVHGLPATWTARATSNEMRIFEGNQPDADDESHASVANPFERSLLAHALRSIMDVLRGKHEAVHFQAILELISFELRNINNGGRFDELLGGLDSITGAATVNDTPSASFQFVRRTDGVVSRVRDRATFVPEQLERLMRRREPSSQSLDGLAAKHEDVSFLKKAVKFMGFRGAEILLRLQKREPTANGERLTFGNFEFAIMLDDETIIPHGALSYGQKRFLAFLYYVAANDDVIIADEIVNGMHYDWIEACLREIGDRQSFLTSQSPLLLDFLPFATEQDVEHTFILCGNEQRDGRRYMVWKNMPEESAQTFFRSYKTQALQVSEILRSRGWW